VFRHRQRQLRHEDQQQNELEDIPFVDNEPVMEDLLEVEEENEEEEALVQEQEIDCIQQHIINYAVNLPGEATGQLQAYVNGKM
jgi:hypothetical protein